MPSYPLTTEPWIPVRDLTTGTHREVGLTEALTRAHELELAVTGGQAAPGGQEHAVLLRVLLAAYDAAAGPADRAEWAAAWRAPALDAARTSAYLDRWAHRLDLYDPHRPAFQAGALTEYPRAYKFLFPVFLGGKTARWFGGADVMDRSAPIPAGAAARYVLVRGAYDVSGIKAGIGGGRTYGAQLGPLGIPTHVSLTARTLKDELLLNLPPAPRTPGDMPVWERPEDLPLTPGASAPVPGRLAWWTWPARLLRLRPDEDGAVTAFAWHDGLRSADGTTAAARAHDPLTAWAGPDRRLPPPASGWSAWYPGLTLLGCSPVVEHAVRAAEDGILAPGLRLRVHASGTTYNQHFTVLTDSARAVFPLGTAALLAVEGSRTRLAAAAHFAGSAPYAINRVCADLPAVVHLSDLYLPDLTTAWTQLVQDLEDGLDDDALAQWREHVTDAAADLARRQLHTRTRNGAEKAAVLAQVESGIRRYLTAIPLDALPPHQGGEKTAPAPRPGKRQSIPVPRPGQAKAGRKPKPGKRIKAFGTNFPSLAALARDERCLVTYQSLTNRLRDYPELTPEEAASTPPTRGRAAAPRN
ncbi:type I-E CRISPR-associated protein Cse1/CasA [Streptomyces sp. NPDC001054]